MNKGIFCISIDLELLWGRRDLDNLDYFEKRIPQERVAINKILKLLVKYNIPATWAIVGKMYQKGNLNYCGLDIVSEIEKDKNQEIGSHSYSHPIFTNITEDEAISEFNKFKKQSFIFPRNKIKYLTELKKSGFKRFRGKDKNEWELIIPRVPPVYSPINNEGLINIPGSLYFVSGRGLKKYIPKFLRYLKCRLGINSAIKQKKIFHIWFHPIDFVDDSKKIFAEFEKILDFASKKRREGVLEILPMKDIS